MPSRQPEASAPRVWELCSRFGRLLLRAHAAPPVLWVEAHGAITPALVRLDLAEAEAFARAHPGGWSYVADTGGVRFVHPKNPFLLRRLRTLPFLERYVVVAPSRLARLLLRAGAPILRPDAVVADVAEARRRVGLDEEPRA